MASENKKSSASKSSRVKDSGIKRPVSAFLMFCSEKRKDIQKDCMTLAESSKILGQMWKELSDTNKQPFIEKSDKDKQRYSDQLLQLGIVGPKRRQSNSNPSSVKKPRKRRNQATHDEEEGPVKKKRDRGPKSSLSTQSVVVVDPSTIHDPKTSLHNAVLPDVDIPVFTDQFLEHNKKLNSKLMKLRQVNKDLVDQKQRLSDSLLAIDKDVQCLEETIQLQITLTDSLDMKLQIARKAVSDFLCGLEQSIDEGLSLSTEEMLDKVINKEWMPLSKESIVKLVNMLYGVLPDLVLKN